VIRRIHVILKLKTEESHRETATRVHGFFADRCPVYRTFKPAIAMTTELVFEDLNVISFISRRRTTQDRLLHSVRIHKYFDGQRQLERGRLRCLADCVAALLKAELT